MAVDTLTKRASALRFGMTHLAGTRPPSGTIDAFERAALLGCYYNAVVFGTICSGWTFGTSETVFAFGTHETVFEFGDC